MKVMHHRFADYLWDDNEAVVLEETLTVLEPPQSNMAERTQEVSAQPSSEEPSPASPAQQPFDSSQPLSIEHRQNEETALPVIKASGEKCEESALQGEQAKDSMSQESSGKTSHQLSVAEANNTIRTPSRNGD